MNVGEDGELPKLSCPAGELYAGASTLKNGLVAPTKAECMYTLIPR